MKKLFLSVIAVFGVYSFSNAQVGKIQKISLGTDFALPLGDSGDTYSFGYGASAKGEFKLMEKLNLTASAGYMHFSLKKDIRDLLKYFGDDTKGSGAIPLKVGATYYFLQKLYVGAEAGAAISTDEEGGTAFTYTPTVGTNIRISEKYGLDIGLRFEGWSRNGINQNFIGLRTAFAFKP
ncbi:TonB-dependent receptor [Chryseobacterium mulctrae]|uniref:hypothetical protein n=1 Tax=Chryseobacterium mulctrae TaxID=2576777 RepID=UPI001116D349|nr:hypothetical protein [Chryseobacterium mulctrae]